MRIHSVLRIIVIWFVLGLGAVVVRAQGTDGGDANWVLLRAVIVDARQAVQTFTLPERRAYAVKLIAKAGFDGRPLNLSVITVTYGSGQSHFEARLIALTVGDHTKPINPTADEQFVASVTLTRAAAPDVNDQRRITVEIWGRVKSGGPGSTAEPAERSRAIEDKKQTGTTPGFYEVPVFFGTTRQQAGENKSQDGRRVVKFGNQAPEPLVLTLGRAVVTVPHDRLPGSLPLSELNLLVTTISLPGREDKSRHFTIAETVTLTQAAFVEQFKSQAGAANRFKGQVLVFVHGYNYSFDDAIFRTAQIAKDMDFDGPAVTFSWRSAGGMLKYRHDLDTAKEAREGLRELLTLIARDTGATAVNLIAHSMGNDPVTEVLRANAETRRSGGTAPDFALNEVVLAAPDVERGVFGRHAAAFAGIAKGGITLYASKNDKALALSKRYAGEQVRAGDVPDDKGIVLVPGVESIDVSDASTSLFGPNHSTFSERKDIIDDMARLFARDRNKHPPDQRFRIFVKQGTDPKTWWRYTKPTTN